MPEMTPDQRYIIVRGRLWRASNPRLPKTIKAKLVHALMGARRAVHVFRDDPKRLSEAHRLVEQAKILLGERGAVWWRDGAPDYNRALLKNSPYGRASKS